MSGAELVIDASKSQPERQDPIQPSTVELDSTREQLIQRQSFLDFLRANPVVPSASGGGNLIEYHQLTELFKRYCAVNRTPVETSYQCWIHHVPGKHVHDPRIPLSDWLRPFIGTPPMIRHFTPEEFKQSFALKPGRIPGIDTSFLGTDDDVRRRPLVGPAGSRNLGAGVSSGLSKPGTPAPSLGGFLSSATPLSMPLSAVTAAQAAAQAAANAGKAGFTPSTYAPNFRSSMPGTPSLPGMTTMTSTAHALAAASAASTIIPGPTGAQIPSQISLKPRKISITVPATSDASAPAAASTSEQVQASNVEVTEKESGEKPRKEKKKKDKKEKKEKKKKRKHGDKDGPASSGDEGGGREHKKKKKKKKHKEKERDKDPKRESKAAAASTEASGSVNATSS